MPRKPSYTQLKAKKKWLLHTSSCRRKFKSKTRLTSQKARRNSWSSSVGNEHISSSQKRTIFRSLSQISGLLQSSKDSEEVFKVSDFDKNSKWLIQRSMGAVLLPINMALYSALMNGTQFFRYYFEAMRNAIAMASESLNSGIKNGFKSVGTYQRKFVQSTTDVVFPSSSYKRKFEELNDRISDLEKEIKKIKTSHSETSCAKCHHSSETSVSVQGLQEKLLPQAPLPPPPPPPPPPLVLPPPPPLNLQLKKKSSASNSQDKTGIKENTKKLVVSLDDIKSVKLRKIQQKPGGDKSPVNNNCKSTRQPLKEIKNNPVRADGKPLVTMEELRGIKLRKKPTGKNHPGSCFKTPENNMVVLRRNLKKVSHKRSPGGTPLDKTIQETGIGLTPMITRALRKKFQLANPPSASPEETSPRKRMRDKSISPIQVSVFSSPSIR